MDAVKFRFSSLARGDDLGSRYPWGRIQGMGGKWLSGNAKSFPRVKHDDLVDTASMATKFLRDNGFLTRAPERLQEIEDSKVYLGRHVSRPLYPA